MVADVSPSARIYMSMQLAEAPTDQTSPAARAIRAAEADLCLLVRSRLDSRRLAPASSLAEARARGVRVRMVCEAGTWLPLEGAEVRAAPRVPGRLLIADRRLALVLDDEGAASAVGHPGLVATLAEAFEHAWASATPLDGSDAGRPDARDAAIFALLGAGLTDEAVAQRIGTSARTVRRRVTALMREAGVRTRFQAGADAVRRGWL